MQHRLRQDVVKRGVRAQVCTKCYQRPAGSEGLPASVSRSCEPGCTVFLNLEQLGRQVEEKGPTALEPWENSIQNVVCQHCLRAPSGGDYCNEGLTRSCPLSRYARDVVTIVQQVYGYESSPTALHVLSHGAR